MRYNAPPVFRSLLNSLLVALYPLPPGRFLIPISVSAAGRIRSIEKYNDLIGNENRGHPAFSIMPQPTTLQRVFIKNVTEYWFGRVYIVACHNRRFTRAVTHYPSRAWHKDMWPNAVGRTLTLSAIKRRNTVGRKNCGDKFYAQHANLRIAGDKGSVIFRNRVHCYLVSTL
jgi:hypothetical protein